MPGGMWEIWKRGGGQGAVDRRLSGDGGLYWLGAAYGTAVEAAP